MLGRPHDVFWVTEENQTDLAQSYILAAKRMLLLRQHSWPNSACIVGRIRCVGVISNQSQKVVLVDVHRQTKLFACGDTILFRRLAPLDPTSL